MATAEEALRVLLPDGGWVISANDFDSIRLDDNIEPITKSQFDAALIKADELKAEAQAEAAAKRAAAEAKLVALGLTADDLKALGL